MFRRSRQPRSKHQPLAPRRSEAELRKLSEKLEEQLHLLTPRGFEEAVAQLLRFSGYLDVQRVGGRGDLGVDLTCRTPEGSRVAVQCKQYAPGRTVGSREIQLFIGMTYTHHEVDERLYLTTGLFTAPAIELASTHSITLVDGPSLARMFAERTPSADQLSDEEVAQLARQLEEAGILTSQRALGPAASTYRVEVRAGEEAPTAGPTAEDLLPAFAHLPPARAAIAAAVTAQGPTQPCPNCGAPMQLMLNPPLWNCWGCGHLALRQTP